MLFSLGEHHVRKLGFAGEYELNADGDTIYKPVPDLNLTTMNGDQIQLGNLEDQIIVLNLIDWPCDEACKKKSVTLVNYLIDVAEKEKWTILTLSVNPETPANELKEFAELHKSEGVQWLFATAPDASSREQFLDYVFVRTGRVQSISELPNTDIVLLDQQKRIREFFDSRIYKENKKLEDAIKMTIKEPFISWKEDKKS